MIKDKGKGDLHGMTENIILENLKMAN